MQAITIATFLIIYDQYGRERYHEFTCATSLWIVRAWMRKQDGEGWSIYKRTRYSHGKGSTEVHIATLKKNVLRGHIKPNEVKVITREVDDLTGMPFEEVITREVDDLTGMPFEEVAD